MRCTNLLLRFEVPELNLAGAQKNVVGHCAEEKPAEDVVGAVLVLVANGLNTRIGFDVPNFDHLVGGERNQVRPVLVDGEVLN